MGNQGAWLMEGFCACRFTGRTIHDVINMGSYNYLGFAENKADFLETVAEKTRQYGVGVCSTRQEVGECEVTIQFCTETQCLSRGQPGCVRSRTRNSICPRLLSLPWVILPGFNFNYISVAPVLWIFHPLLNYVALEHKMNSLHTRPRRAAAKLYLSELKHIMN